ncbi:metallophosphoesterase family protein [Sphingobacterium paludis]|uniref:3',5'-cyclic AMP phosphodiesterase CpdA n=1 Tax=Sphingobacterium paludis TaxID=1476465 RepID=A0A4R7CYI3_9SPHI|nr:metallophosphoesterase [Sphingobacterium paludis]TDS12952.1 3',5'-cyclic AMP phosphodiesterase CpdA [Sphingobacterium paludis]
MFTRKEFLKVAGTGAISLLLPSDDLRACAVQQVQRKGLRFAVISDVHVDLMHDGERRLALFINQIQQDKPDFIIQLGDFCMPHARNQRALDIWNSFPDNYHVLGNHDTDHGFTRDQVMKFWDMPSPYYSFDKNGYHIVVLNGNEKVAGTKLEGYPRGIGKAQLEWLKKDLMDSRYPTVICCHQGLDNEDGGLENGMEVRYLLERVNANPAAKKVRLVLSGHHHLNYHNEINGIHYVQINSASYYWVDDENYKGEQFDDAFYQTYTALKHTMVYEDPIWATVELTDNKIQVSGKETSFVGMHGKDLDMDRYKNVYPITARIDSRTLRKRKA